MFLTICIFHDIFTGFLVGEDEELEPSSSVEDMSAKSAETIILGKALNVKCRSLGKYQLLLPLAKALVKAGHVKIEVEDSSEVNYRDMSRKQVKKCADIESLSKTTQSESMSPGLDDSASVVSKSHP